MDVAIIGAGRAGRALGRLARQAGYALGPVVCRTAEHAREAASFIGAGRPTTALEGAALTLLAVPDREIRPVAGRLRLPPGAVLAHTCAAFGAEALRPHQPAGAIHPLRSFGDPARAVEAFPGTACAVDGDPEAVDVLEAFVRAIGGAPLRVRSDQKPLYHAGAVFASNYLLSILEAGLRLFEQAGVPRAEALGALVSLSEGTLANARAVGIPGALTGPVERGDEETVRRHAQALRERAPELSAAYADLARLATEIALEKGSIDPLRADRLRAALEPAGGDSFGGARPRKEASRR
jgi:predicted short-subunit dehydrogenase-like oxidoreductase (DUF2520 family)